MTEDEIYDQILQDAIEESEAGWLSDLQHLAPYHNPYTESINFKYTEGSIDLGHLSHIIGYIVEIAIEKERRND